MNMRKHQRSRDDFNYVLEQCKESLDPIYDLIVRGCLCELDKQEEDLQISRRNLRNNINGNNSNNNNNNNNNTTVAGATATTTATAANSTSTAAANNNTQTPTTTGTSLKAQEMYRRALALDPNNYHANYFLGYTLSEDKKYEESIVLFEKAATVAPFSPYVFSL